MSRLDQLPADQRAALLLLLRQRKSYTEVAALLGIPERAVHDRAHAALAVLAPRQARPLSAERRAQIGEYLLGQQQRLGERVATRGLLSDSEPARAWARELAQELAPIAHDGLPEIPAPAAIAASNGRGEAPARPPAPGDAPAAAAAGGALPSWRLGGAVLLAGLLAAAIVAVVLLTGGGSAHPRTSSAAAVTKAASSGPKLDQRLALQSPDPTSHAVALVEVLSEGSKRAFYVAAEHLPPSRGFSYVIWLYNSSTSYQPVSRVPKVGSSGRLAGGSFLPANAGDYHEMILTRETSGSPSHPGPIVLQGGFSLGG